MSSKILFGNSVGYKINNYLIKKKIIDYLQDNVDVFRFNDNYYSYKNQIYRPSFDMFKGNLLGAFALFYSNKMAK